MNITTYIKVILVNFFIFFFGLLIIELFFGNWFNNKNYGNLLLNINKHRIISNLPYNSDKPVKYSTDLNGFRANDHNLSKIDILVLGGSTTEQKLIDDKLIWTKILEQNLDLPNLNYTLNAGIGGQTSFGHVKIFNLWISRFEELKPEIIIYYIGINDALYMIENIDKDINYDEGRFMRDKNRDFLTIQNKFENYFQYFKNNSAIILFLKMLNGNFISFKYNFGYLKKTTIFDTSFKSTEISDIKIDDKKVLNYLSKYRYNIQILSENASNLDAMPVFITQRVSRNHWIKKYLSIINEETINFCRLKSLTCFDLANELYLNEEDFYDGIHYTPLGSKKVGEYIYQKLKLNKK